MVGSMVGKEVLAWMEKVQPWEGSGATAGGRGAGPPRGHRMNIHETRGKTTHRETRLARRGPGCNM